MKGKQNPDSMKLPTSLQQIDALLFSELAYN